MHPSLPRNIRKDVSVWFNQGMWKPRFPVIFSLLFIASCGGPVTTTPVPSQQSQQSIRYLALGDSYTIGESVSEGERWPNQLAGMLSEKGVQVDVTIIARTGWTTSELWEGIQANPPQGTYDLVSLLIGVNNQYRGYDINEYRKEFRFLMQKSIEYAGGDANRVIVLSIPDWGVTPFAAGQDSLQIASQIDMFNAVNREETESAGAHYVDITPISKQALNDISLIAGDGLHPSGKMYKMWAEKALPVAVESLGKK
jgi:lysophospholipase L1-like esterase